MISRLSSTSYGKPAPLECDRRPRPVDRSNHRAVPAFPEPVGFPGDVPRRSIVLHMVPRSTHQPRRWLLVLLIGVLVVCVGAPVASVIVWFGRGTLAAAQGQPSPSAAVNVFMLAVSNGEEIGLRSALAEEHRDELVDRWRRIRADVARTDPPPSKVETAAINVDAHSDEVAHVVADVQAIWWPRDGSGLSMHGDARPWRFETRRDRGGWRVWSIDAPPWCGGHVRADACR